MFVTFMYQIPPAVPALANYNYMTCTMVAEEDWLHCLQIQISALTVWVLIDTSVLGWAMDTQQIKPVSISVEYIENLFNTKTWNEQFQVGVRFYFFVILMYDPTILAC